MFGFGNKKKEEEEEKAKQEQIAQAMKAMSDQIGQQAQMIKQLQDQLTTAKADDAKGDAATKALAAAQAQLKQMHDEMEKLKAKATAPDAPAAGKAAGAVGVTKVVASSGAAGAAGAAAGALGGAAPASTGGLAVGGTAYVQKAGGKNLRMRSAAGLDSSVVDGLPPGTQMTLLGGPTEKDGYPWWHIRTSDGREGWVAGTELVTHPD